MNRTNAIVLLVALAVSACAVEDDKPAYVYPDDIQTYRIKAGDISRYFAQIVNFSGSGGNDVLNTYDLEYEWSADISSLTPSNTPQEIEEQNLLTLRVENAIPGTQNEIRTLYFTQPENGELLLVGLRDGDQLYWLYNETDSAYGATYLPSAPAALTASVTTSGSIRKCDNSGCRNIGGDFSIDLALADPRVVKTLYAEFETVAVDRSINLTINDNNVFISYGRQEQVYYTPLAGEIAFDVRFNDTQQLNPVWYSALLSQTTISIDGKYKSGN